MSQRYIGGLIYNPPGGFSGYFDGSGDYLTLSSNASMDFGAGAFTIECWVQSSVFSVSASASRTIIGNSGNSYTMQLYIETGAGKIVFGNTGSTNLQGTSTVADGNWHHVVVSRSGTGSNQTALFVDGIRQAVGTNSQNYTSGTIYIGAFDTANGFWNGYISNLRIVKGTAVYDPTQTTLTVPVGRLQAITNTALLTCAYSTFSDGSTNAYTVTTNGNTAVSAQNPFPLNQLPNPALGNAGNGVYNMSQYRSLLGSNQWPAVDPYFDYTTLMLHGNGTNGAQNNTFLDSSTNNFTITRNGNTTQGTFTPYGSNWSNYFDGTGDWLTVPSNTAFAFNGAYTVEFWLFPLVQYGSSSVVGFVNETTTGGFVCYIDSSSRGITIGTRGGSNQITTGAYPTANTWNHIVVCRDVSNNTSVYLNGTRIGTASLSTSYTSSGGTVEIGTLATTSYPFTGYMSNLRIVKGTAVYDPTQTTITVPTGPLTAITNTSLLTCQSNRFIDNSSNAFTITRNGDVSVQRFSPFNPTAAYSTSVIGGSGYFDGSGDYLNGPTTGQFAPTGDFTISMWFYPTSFAASYYVLAGSWNAGASDEWLIQYDNTGAIRFLTTTDSTFSAAGVVKLNQWQFLSISRSGSTVTGYINGTSFRSYTLTGTVGSATKTVYVGIQAGTTWPYVGYISDYRLVAGSAQSATPPTSPATAISGTNTLLNFTNGGIIDNAMMNDLETVGNAQISTSVSKFGGGSMYFDGTGDYLQIPNSQNFVFGAGNWTVECWVYLNSTARQGFVALENSSGTNVAWELGLNASTKFRVLVQTSAGQVVIDGTTTPTTGVWYHLAAVRNGSTVTLYVNGTSEATGSVSTNAIVAESSPVFVGQYGYGFQMNGYIDDLRITKGIARYTANFTPPTSQFQDQ